MTTQDTVDELIDYYINLLIIQYSIQPKALATINILAEVVVASGIYFDVENAYNIDPDLGSTAVGDQLDVIGKYVGVDRFYTAIDLTDYFSLVTYSQALSLPSSPPQFGMSDYANFNDFSYNGTLDYNDIITSENALSDSDFLTLIQFAILCNTMNYSAAAIDDTLWKIFGSQVRAETAGKMTISYFFTGPISTLLNTIIFKGLLPAPMGVEILIVQFINNLMFGLTNYAESDHSAYSAFAYGFSTYSNYATLPGKTLTYSQISQG